MANAAPRLAMDPYVPRLGAEWDLDAPDDLWRELPATCCFVDISGFTALSERLARRGRIGAEELTEVLNHVFSRMLEVVYAKGGALLKFGGDALLLAFADDDHARIAAEAAVAMPRRCSGSPGRCPRPSAGSISACPSESTAGRFTSSRRRFAPGAPDHGASRNGHDPDGADRRGGRDRDESRHRLPTPSGRSRSCQGRRPSPPLAPGRPERDRGRRPLDPSPRPWSKRAFPGVSASGLGKAAVNQSTGWPLSDS